MVYLLLLGGDKSSQKHDISRATIQRILLEHALRPHRHKYYLQITDPDFFPKMEHIIGCYLNPNVIDLTMPNIQDNPSRPPLDPRGGANTWPNFTLLG